MLNISNYFVWILYITEKMYNYIFPGIQNLINHMYLDFIIYYDIIIAVFIYFSRLNA